jgi:sn-glycerol 3-phosphate transport system ATP-binding protein
MNFLPATLLEGGAGARLASGQEIVFADGPRPGAAGIPLTLGLRPEHVLVGEAPDALPLTVDLVEPLGSETVVHGRLPDGVPLTVRVNGPFAGSNLTALLDPRELHVFDGGTGKRLEAG